MTLISKTIISEADKVDKLAKIRQVRINSKSFESPAYFPKIESSIELEEILSNDDHNSITKGLVFEIQDYVGITNRTVASKGQTTLDPDIEPMYERFLGKIIIIDTMPEVLYYRCRDREEYKKLMGLPQPIKDILDRSKRWQYISKWRIISSQKKGLNLQKYAISKLSSLGSDVVLPLVPYLYTPSKVLLRIARDMNQDLQKALSLSLKMYDCEPSYYFAMDHRVFSDRAFKDELVQAIYHLAQNQNTMEEDPSPFRKSTMTFIKVLNIDSKNVACRKNFRDFLKEISAWRDLFGLSFVFLDTTDLFGQLTLTCGSDAFSERTTSRRSLRGSGSSGYSIGSIYLAGDEYECTVDFTNVYFPKFEENNDCPLCAHEYCKTHLKRDVLDPVKTNYNKMSRRIHNVLSKFDHISEVKKHIENHDIASITWKIGNSNDINLNYVNPYYRNKEEAQDEEVHISPKSAKKMKEFWNPRKPL